MRVAPLSTLTVFALHIKKKKISASGFKVMLEPFFFFFFFLFFSLINMKGDRLERGNVMLDPYLFMLVFYHL
jgi:hypothetical protein